MDKRTIVAEYKFKRTKKRKKHEEFELQSIEYGKLLIPLRLRIKTSCTGSDVIAVQLFDSCKWSNCKFHKLEKKPMSKGLYTGSRRVKQWSMHLEILKYRSGDALKIKVLVTEPRNGCVS